MLSVTEFDLPRLKKPALGNLFGLLSTFEAGEGVKLKGADIGTTPTDARLPILQPALPTPSMVKRTPRQLTNREVRLQLQKQRET